MWSILLVSGRVPELDAKPVETALHLTAEFLTALALIAAGTGMLTGQRWGRQAYLVSMGMLLYSSFVGRLFRPDRPAHLHRHVRCLRRAGCGFHYPDDLR
jgi:hypothetical protein